MSLDKTCSKLILNNYRRTTKHISQNLINKSEIRIQFSNIPVQIGKTSRRTTDTIKGRQIRYTALYKLKHKNKKDEFVSDTFKDFFKLPKEEVSKTWKEDTNFFQKSELDFKRKMKALSHENILETENSKLLADISHDVKRAVKINCEVQTLIPNSTRKALHLEKKTKASHRIRKMLNEDYPIFENKIKNKKIDEYRYEFMYQWFNKAFNEREEALKSFAQVFHNIGQLQSTKEFCHWLRRHPEIEPPSYLLENSYLVENVDCVRSSIDIAKRMRRENIHLSVDITDDFIKKHFEKLKALCKGNTVASTLDHRFVSDVDIII